jgi:GAF domain-containing protein
VDREVTDSRQANRLLSEENAVMEMIASNQPLEDTLAQICTMIETQLAGGRCSVMLLTEDGQHLHVASGNRLPAGYLPDRRHCHRPGGRLLWHRRLLEAHHHCRGYGEQPLVAALSGADAPLRAARLLVHTAI